MKVKELIAVLKPYENIDADVMLNVHYGFIKYDKIAKKNMETELMRDLERIVFSQGKVWLENNRMKLRGGQK